MWKIYYLCNGQKEDCQKRNCYINGGNCKHTSDINRALNFEIKGSYKNGGSFYEKEDVKEQTLFSDEELAKVETEEERQHLIECAKDNSKIDMKYFEIMKKYDLFEN